MVLSSEIMKRIIILFILFVPLWILQSAFVVNDDISFPHRKIHRTIKKILKLESVEIIQFDDIVQPITGSFYYLKSKNVLQAYLYVGRVNSCRSGGCAINQNDINLSYEFFDYFIITDTIASIKKVQIFNYQATQGHEVMSHGWLRQFVGYDGGQKLRYGHETEAISWATVSAKALNIDLQSVIKLLNQ